MKKLLARKLFFVVLLLAVAAGAYLLLVKNPTIDFNTQVKPIFNKKCRSCDGGVKREGGFSVLFRTDALAPTESGKPAIIPGNASASEMIRRLELDDPEERMPYKHDPLSKEEISILRNWVKQGAQWGDHWAYVPVKPVDIPQTKTLQWGNNYIDKFIVATLESNQLQPSREADKKVLLRRASLDLIGLPAPDTIAKQFLQSNDSKAYERLIDSLLASRHFGEKWAAMWLDLARYADTKGYERDASRGIWRYRDWLIDAFNKDKPYDQFLIEQLAGDLIPNATDEQFIATAFHRNTMTNDEGGTDNEEFRTAAVMDRVNTTWEALMGTTFACVQCHSHPYDPFRHEEYYKFMAFFNNTRDEDTYADYPLLRHYNDSAKAKMKELLDWMRPHADEKRVKETKQFLQTWQPAYNSLTCDKFVNSELVDTKWLGVRNNAVCRLQKVNLSGKDELLMHYQGYVNNANWSIHLDAPDGALLCSVKLPKTTNGWQMLNIGLNKATGVHDLYFVYNSPDLKKPDDNGAMFDWFYFTESFPGKDQPGYAQMKKRYADLLNMEVPTTPIMMDNPGTMHRDSYVFERGNWLVKTEKVEPATPNSLNAFPKSAPRNRYGLAMWMVAKENPLTSRAIVNRIWEQLFGNGLAETLEDLGTQGIAPTHRELLDHLSSKLMNEYKWSLKKLMKEIMMSTTYKQDSKVSPLLLEKDPYNKFYARGPRVRLSAEQIRDQSLAVCGLLSDKLKGPSVFPYQPKGIWQSPWNGADWKISEGDDQYRRAMYTYWKRTSPYPSMMTFDGAAREVCVARRVKTNTPLQALVTMNDSAFVEAAKYFAIGLQKEFPGDAGKQIRSGFEKAIGRAIDEKSFGALNKLYQTALAKFEAKPVAAAKLLGNDKGNKDPDTAALTVVTNAIFNLDEFVTKN